MAQRQWDRSRSSRQAEYNALRLLRNKDEGVKNEESKIILKYSFIKALKGMLVKCLIKNIQNISLLTHD
jgi:hypothetical protein